MAAGQNRIKRCSSGPVGDAGRTPARSGGKQATPTSPAANKEGGHRKPFGGRRMNPPPRAGARASSARLFQVKALKPAKTTNAPSHLASEPAKTTNAPSHLASETVLTPADVQHKRPPSRRRAGSPSQRRAGRTAGTHRPL